LAFEDFAEYGKSNVDSDWTTITLSKSYARNIAIFAEVNSFNDGAPSTNRSRNLLAPVEIRLRNINKGSGNTPASFDIKIQRPYGYDATHPSEQVSFLAICEGTWDLIDNTRIEVGLFDRIHNRNNKFQGQLFSTAFNAKPGLISQVQTYAGDHWITLRHRNVTSTGFQVAHQEDEYYNKRGSKEHEIESLAYLAFDDGFSTTDGDSLIEGQLLDSQNEKVDHTGKSYSFVTNNFSENPVLLTQITSYSGNNPASTRLSALSTTSFDAYVQEDRSRDKETWHKTEEISYFAVADGTKFQGEIVVPNAAPSIQGFSGSLGDLTSSIDVNENTIEIGTFTANKSVTWSLTGGTDQALVSLDAATGELNFLTAQDFETPGDSDSNNDFVVEVTATDSDNNAATHTATINVIDLDETAPVANDNIESLGGGSVSSNIDILANDEDNLDDSNNLLVYSINGVLFDDLDDSEHSTYGVDSSFKQLVGDSGTLYIKNDGTAYYLKSSRSSKSSKLSKSLKSYQSSKFSTVVTEIDSFTYVAVDSSGNSSNNASITIKSSSQSNSGGQSGSNHCGSGMTLVGNHLTNRLSGSCGGDSLYGHDGGDILYGYGDDDYLNGGSGSDRLFGGAESDTCVGGKGNDLIEGSQGDDVLIGNRGGDRLYGDSGRDVIYAGKGADILAGGSGSDSLYGGFGLNTFKDELDGRIDSLYFQSDQYAVNSIYGKAFNNPNGEKADKIELLDSFDKIYVQGVETSQLSYGLVDHNNRFGETLSGIGIYASGVLEAVYVGDNLSLSEIAAMTQGLP